MPLVFSILKAKVGRAVPAHNIYSRYEEVVQQTEINVGIGTVCQDSILYHSVPYEWLLDYASSNLLASGQWREPFYPILVQGYDLPLIGGGHAIFHSLAIEHFVAEKGIGTDYRFNIGDALFVSLGKNPYLTVTNEGHDYYLDRNPIHELKIGLNAPNLQLDPVVCCLNEGHDFSIPVTPYAEFAEIAREFTYLNAHVNSKDGPPLTYGIGVPLTLAYNNQPYTFISREGAENHQFKIKSEAYRKEMLTFLLPLVNTYDGRSLSDYRNETITAIGQTKIVIFLNDKAWATEYRPLTYGKGHYSGTTPMLFHYQTINSVADRRFIEYQLDFKDVIDGLSSQVVQQPFTFKTAESSNTNLVPETWALANASFNLNRDCYTVLTEGSEYEFPIITGLISAITWASSQAYTVLVNASLEIQTSRVETAEKTKYAHNFPYTSIKSNGFGLDQFWGNSSFKGISFIPYAYNKGSGYEVSLNTPGIGYDREIPYRVDYLSNVIPAANVNSLIQGNGLDLKIPNYVSPGLTIKIGQTYLDEFPVIGVQSQAVTYNAFSLLVKEGKQVEHEGLAEAENAIGDIYVPLLLSNVNPGTDLTTPVASIVKDQLVTSIYRPIVIQRYAGGQADGNLPIAVSGIAEARISSYPVLMDIKIGQGFGEADDSAWFDPLYNTQYEEPTEDIENLIVELGETVTIDHQLRVGKL